jgi:pectin methylesterase-like acyl-CoA thioesterase
VAQVAANSAGVRSCSADYGWWDNVGPCAASLENFNVCFIEDNVDYIFGDVKAVFRDCELHSRPRHEIMITAQSKHFPAEDSGYYFLNCKITGTNNGDQVVLGRPWRDYATVLFDHTDIEQTLAPEGWSDWGGRLKTAEVNLVRQTLLRSAGSQSRSR